MRKRDPEKLNDLAKVAHLISGRVGDRSCRYRLALSSGSWHYSWMPLPLLEKRAFTAPTFQVDNLYEQSLISNTSINISDEKLLFFLVERKSELGNFKMMYYLILFSPSFVLCLFCLVDLTKYHLFMYFQRVQNP